MEGAGDPDNRRDFPGGFPEDTTDAFLPAGRTHDQQKLYEFTSDLGRLRAHSPALQGGAQQDIVVGKDTFAYVRVPAPGPSAGTSASACAPSAGGPAMVIAVNRSSSAGTISLPSEGNVLQSCSKLTYVFGDKAQSSALTIALPPLRACYLPHRVRTVTEGTAAFVICGNGSPLLPCVHSVETSFLMLSASGVTR